SLLLIAGGAVLATLHAGALLLSAAGIGILLIALVGRRQLADPRTGYKEEFTRLGLSHAPAAWSPPAVRECLSRLFELQANARRAEEAQNRLARSGPALQSAREEEGELEHRLTEAAGELGLPDAEVGALGWMLERLARWHRAVEDADSASARLRQAS